MTEGDDFPFWSYEDVALLVAAVLPSWLASLLLVQACGVTSKGGQTLLFQSAFFALLLTVLYLLVAWRYQRPFWRSMGWSWPVRGAWWCIAGGPVLAFSVAVLGVVLRAPEVPDPVKDLITGRASLAIVMLFAAVLGPIYEELFFRGFLFPLLAKSFGALAGVLLSALPFALLHGSQYQWAWQQITLVGIAGAAFGFVRHQTGSTAASTILHGCFNLTQFIAFLVLRG
jgi:membrane protease YdiL (CAAX protease family)